MTDSQRTTLRVTIVAIVLTVIFPPFAETRAQGGIVGHGFGFILSWPQAESYFQPVIHTSTLLLEWAAIGIASSLSWILYRPEDKNGVIDSIVCLANRHADLRMNVARIQADALIRAAEIRAKYANDEQQHAFQLEK